MALFIIKTYLYFYEKKETIKIKAMNNYDDNEDYNQKDIVQLMLKIIIESVSEKKVMKCLLALASKEKDGEIELEDKIPSSTLNLLAIIYKTYGSNNVLKAFLDLDSKKNKKRKKLKKKKEKKEKFIKAPNKSIGQEKEKEENKENDVDEYTYYGQGNDPINLTQNKNMPLNGLFIEIDNSKKSTDYNNHVISLEENENDSSNSLKNDDNCSAKSEIKFPKPTTINLGKKIAKRNVQRNKGIKSESKIFKVVKKFLQGKILCKPYHYTILYGHLFKYRFVEVNEGSNIAKYTCEEPKCRSIAEYNIISGIFNVKIWHSIGYNEHGYVKDSSSENSKVLDYMKKNNALDLQTDK